MEPNFPALKDEISTLLRKKDFSQARRILRPIVSAGRTRLDADQLTWARQKLALSTYKDPELQTEAALAEAMCLLRSENSERPGIAETLNLIGAVHKRLWEVTGDETALRWARAYYRDGLTAGRADENGLGDWTYAAINLAYVLDLMARREQAVEGKEYDERAAELRSEADREREAVRAARPELLAGPAPGWWAYATVAEACFGLCRAEEAQAVLAEGLAIDRADWELESTARQLVALAHLRYHGEAEQRRAIDALSPLLRPGAARSLLGGKLGLALSGGGFRAALFHVGVLARLAELDLLRHVEVLSCVSGGSILGALYFLELRELLRTKRDGEVTPEDYLKVVRAVATRLEKALTRNIRTAAFRRSLLNAAADRTKLTGLLLDEALYRIAGQPALKMRDLVFEPAGETDFNPKLHNWRREAKVPILILNCTTLNTGHNWQFTASWAGEAPTCMEPAIDASERLRRFYYERDKPPPPHGDVLLSTAVAASAAVPGIFRPIPLPKLYKDHPTIRLSDGGVHDNQGVFGLMEQDCNLFLVSDGSGQLPPRKRPPWFFSGVLQRTTDILMDVVRRNAYRTLEARRRTRRLKDLRYIHLKKGLPTEDVTWIGGTDAPSDAVVDPESKPGLNERAQRCLAAIRTDLDNFSTNECNALMYAGYCIADHELRREGFPLPQSALSGGWGFLEQAGWMAKETSLPEDVARELDCGRHRLFRPLRFWWSGKPWARWARA